MVGLELCAGEDLTGVVRPIAVVENNQSRYYWNVQPVAGSAQMLTLFCRACNGELQAQTSGDVPLVAVLRDTLGDDDPAVARLTDVWLLDYANPGIGKKMLSAVPFFYWHPGDGSKSRPSDNPKPLFDLTTPQHPVLVDTARDLLQWTALDPMFMPVRATSRAYRTNGLDDERLDVETAISYLEAAPLAESGLGLTESERATVIARLELRKKLLGGLVSDKRATKLGEVAGYEEERIRSRNWELLRQLAEKTGLLFQPLEIAGNNEQYAMLSLPLSGSAPHSGIDLKPIWKLLNIRNPWTDERLTSGQSQGVQIKTYEKSVTDDQSVPLAVYSLSYPKLPLLLVDFRDQLHVRRHEMTQRSINEITAGVIGISHFTNWYYYVAADLYDFVSGRHGAAIDHAERLDAYSRLRTDLALDTELEPTLRKSIQSRLDSLSVNPLEGAPAREIRNAQVRYARLQEQSGTEGYLATLLDEQRRTEQAEFGKSQLHVERDLALRTASFGVYHDRVSKSAENLSQLKVYRRIEKQLAFLDDLAAAGTDPAVTYGAARIRDSVRELVSLMPTVDNEKIRRHAASTLETLRKISPSPELQSEYTSAITDLTRTPEWQHNVPARGIAAEAAISAQAVK
jgi:hypothetical protein